MINGPRIEEILEGSLHGLFESVIPAHLKPLVG
jgi:hypothetical protein